MIRHRPAGDLAGRHTALRLRLLECASSIIRPRKQLLNLRKPILARLSLSRMTAVRALHQLAVLADRPLVGASRALRRLDLQGVGKRAGDCVAHASDMARAPCAFYPVRRTGPGMDDASHGA